MRLTLPTDRLILERLLEGRNLAINIATEIDRSPGYVNRRMLHLKDYWLVNRVGPAEDTGLYEITDRGVAVLRLVDEYSPDRAFEQRVDERAESIEVYQCCVIDPEDESGAASGPDSTSGSDAGLGPGSGSDSTSPDGGDVGGGGSTRVE